MGSKGKDEDQSEGTEVGKLSEGLHSIFAPFRDEELIRKDLLVDTLIMMREVGKR
jgi:hypothetical protein